MYWRVIKILIFVFWFVGYGYPQANGANSILSGNWTGTTIEPFITHRILVHAKDSSNADVNTGDQEFVVEIKDRWTKYDYFRCDNTTSTVLSQSLVGKMSYNSGNEYYYDFTVEAEGDISIIVSLVQNGVKAHFYDNTAWTEPFDVDDNMSAMNIDFGAGSYRSGGINDSFSAKFDFYFVPSTTGAHTFDFNIDDWMSAKLNNQALTFDTNTIFHFITSVVSFHFNNIASKFNKWTIL